MNLRKQVFRSFNAFGKPEFFRWSGEKRSPKKGEFFLSGAIPEVYRAPNDLAPMVYHIMEPVKLEPNEKLIDGRIYIPKEQV